MKSHLAKIWLYTRLGLYIIIPLVLLWLPADYFDTGPSRCLSVMLFDMECYGCGMSRSIMHLIHFDFREAWYYHPLGFVVFPLLAWLWLDWFRKDWRKLKSQ